MLLHFRSEVRAHPVLSLAIILLAAGCRRGERNAAAADSARPDVRGPMPPSVAFRLPSAGGTLRVYELPTLRETSWGGGGRVSGARSALGADVQGRRLLYRDTSGAIASFDLVALRERTVAPARFIGAVGPDGTLLAVDPTGQVVESQPWGTRPWSEPVGRGAQDVFAAPGARIIVVRDGGADSLAVAAREGGLALAVPVPGANDRAATAMGDAVTLATDSGIVVVEVRSGEDPWFLGLNGRPRAVAFSPSGHRIYVALRDRAAIVVIDRFGRRERGHIELPAPALLLRVDPWGRALLARGEAGADGGAVWVVSLARLSVAHRVRTRWASDLPAVSEDGVLLAREDRSVVARDLRTLDSLGAVADAADDLWFTGRWVPTSATAAARAEQAERRDRRGGTERQRAETRRDTGAASRTFWIQIASSRNEDAIRALAASLLAERLPARVVAPRLEGDPWRVMAGPYRSRQAADSAGRALGRPYWVQDRRGEQP